MPTIRINICQLKGFCEPFRRRVGECTLLKYKFLLDINCQNFGNIIQQKLYIKM